MCEMFNLTEFTEFYSTLLPLIEQFLVDRGIESYSYDLWFDLFYSCNKAKFKKLERTQESVYWTTKEICFDKGLFSEEMYFTLDLIECDSSFEDDDNDDVYCWREEMEELSNNSSFEEGDDDAYCWREEVSKHDIQQITNSPKINTAKPVCKFDMKGCSNATCHFTHNNDRGFCSYGDNCRYKDSRCPLKHKSINRNDRW